MNCPRIFLFLYEIFEQEQGHNSESQNPERQKLKKHKSPKAKVLIVKYSIGPYPE